MGYNDIMKLELKRHTVTQWDCGCLTWIENDTNEYTLLPCNQKGCRVTKVVKELSLTEGRKTVFLEVKRRAE